MFTKKAVAALIATVVVVLLLAAPVLANRADVQQASGDGPSWGYGPPGGNGPPGQTGDDRPGVGHGDTNHDHTGPPGQANNGPE